MSFAQFTVHSLPFTVRLRFTVYHWEQKTDHRKCIEKGKKKTENSFTGGKA